MQLSQSSQPVGRLVGKMIVLAVSLHLLLSLGSLLVIGWREPYDGPLKVHLPIYAGELHYARMPSEYWQHRILMLKAMGLNAVSTYVFWNYHELSKGQFDFATNDRNLTAFLEIAHKHQMRVLLRPGPYICAEWDFGGLPARLLGIQNITLRSTDPAYEDQVKIYFSAVADVIKPWLFAAGGPIIMMQIQNELGYINSSPQHTLSLIAMWRVLGVDSEFYYEDAGELWESNYWPGAHLALSQTSGMLKYLHLELSPKLDEDSFVFGGEVYSGWFNDWGDGGWESKDAAGFAASIDNLLAHNKSVNIFLAFGGTNFATTAGANGFNPFYSYIPHITSYDENAPVSERGEPTDKYYRLREVFQKYNGKEKQITAVPKPMPVGVVSSISISEAGNLFSNLPVPSVMNGSLTFFESNILQMYNQGIVLYETILHQAKRYSFRMVTRDFCLLFLNDTYIRSFTRGITEIQQVTIECEKVPCRLRVLVEAMGHVNFGKGQGRDRKGLVSFQQPVQLHIKYRWDIYKFQLRDIQSGWNKSGSGPAFPTLFRGIIMVKNSGDVFLSMQEWGKGYVWVNGHNLGRYWAIGPQKRLFCPGVWLKEGQNELSVLELTGIHGGITVFDSAY